MTIALSRKNRLIVAIAIIAIIVLAVGIFKMFADNTAQSSLSSGSQQSQSDSQLAEGVWALNATSVDLEKLKGEGVPIIIDFGADSCVPCKEMAPVLKKVNSEMQGKAIVQFVDVWKNPSAAAGFPVQIIPTQLLFSADGKPYVPSAEVAEKLGLEFFAYEDEGATHVFTAHQGGLSEAQMNGILSDMGV